MIAEIIFFVCLGLLVQVYILYPWTMKFLSLFKKTPRQPSAATPLQEGRKISIIISAHNEENIIEEKIKNTLELDYPNFEILIGDDGSTDKTAEIIAKYEAVRLIKNERNEGKAATMNKLCSVAAGEIFLFTDANTMIEKSALKHLVNEFADEKVGCVCGQLVLNAENFDLSKGESKYWKGESKLKMLESNFGAVMGSNGALYAIRSNLYSQLPTDKTVMDDFYITVKILMKNYLCVFNKNAIAFENTSASKYGEFNRKVRIGRANFNFLFAFVPLLNPLHPMRAYIFLSHKLLRWLSPFLLIAVFACSAVLYYEHIFYRAFFAFELLFFAFAILYVKIARYFLSMNFALLLGFFKSFFKEKSGAWKKEARN